MGRSGAKYAPSASGLLLPAAAGMYSCQPGNTAATSPTQSVEYAMPVTFSNVPSAITAIGVNCTTGAASNVIRFGLRANDAAFPHPYPGTLITDFGTVSVSGTGWKEVTSLNQAVSPLVQYWFTVTLQGGTGAALSGFNGNAQPMIWSAAPAALVVGGYSQTGVTGALGAGWSSTITSVTAFRLGIKFT